MINRQTVLVFLLAARAILSRGADFNELSSAEQDALRLARQGTLVRLPGIASRGRMLSGIPIRRSVMPGPPLLFSDMPEYLGAQNGICVAEDVSAGPCRLYMYHVPGTTNSSRVVSAVIENLSSQPLTVNFTHYALARPGTDYPVMGVEALTQFFTGRWLPPSFSVAPAERKVLDAKMDDIAAADPQLVHAFYEFNLDEPARLWVLQRNTNQSSAELAGQLPPFPRGKSGAGRGLFPNADLAVTNAPGCVIDTANGVQRLVLADGGADPWVVGTDALAGNITVTNKGSYGVIYHITLAYTSSDGRALALLIGGPGGRRGREARPAVALKISAGVWPGGWLSVSGRGRGTFAVAQVFPPPARGATSVLEMIYSPPGGSSLPTPIFFAPFRP